MSEWLNPYDFPPENEQRRLHLGRYQWAAIHVKGSLVANAACSCNYGSDILMKAENAAHRVVVGFDRNPKGLALAKQLYPYPVVQKDIQDEPFYGFDSLVCLETFEHLERPWEFLDQIAPTVKEIVLSTPVIPTKHFNEFHLHDFTKADVTEGLESRGWRIESVAYQDESNLSKPTYGLFYARRK